THRAGARRDDQHHAAGGVDGRHIELSVKDNRSDPTLSVANINAFVNDHSVVGIVMGACSACVTGVAKVLDNAKLPTVSLAPATEVARPVSDRQYVFKLGPNADDSTATLATSLRASGVHRVALLTTDDVNGSDVVTALDAQLPR